MVWVGIRSRFIQALSEHRIDKWLIEESRNSGDVATKFRQLNDITAFVKFLDEQVKQEQSELAGNNGGAFFVSFGSEY